MAAKSDPLLSPPPSEVPLPHAPLVRVIAQLRFSPILLVESAKFIATFQEALRPDYPDLHKEHAQSLLLGTEGVASAQKQIAWRFTDLDGAWRVSLTPEFVALETTAYTSRGDFIERMRTILEAVAEYLEPAVAQRIGLRYIDRVTGDALGDIASLVRPEMLGLVGTPLFEHAQHSITEALLDVPDGKGQLRARWGHLPAGATVDMDAIEAIEEPSWILDFDMFSALSSQQCPFPFSTDRLIENLSSFAEHIYAMFRWSVTDEFLRQYGGKP